MLRHACSVMPGRSLPGSWATGLRMASPTQVHQGIDVAELGDGLGDNRIGVGGRGGVAGEGQTPAAQSAHFRSDFVDARWG